MWTGYYSETMHKQPFSELVKTECAYLDISPFFGFIVKNNLKSLCGFISIIFPSASTPRSLTVRTPLGSNKAFKRSSTAGLHKFTLSTSNQYPFCKH